MPDGNSRVNRGAMPQAADELVKHLGLYPEIGLFFGLGRCWHLDDIQTVILLQLAGKTMTSIVIQSKIKLE